MPAQTTITAVDGKATPLTHTFTVMGAVSNAGEIIATWINRAASTLTGGAEQLKSYFKTKADGACSIRIATVIPITEVVGGVSIVTRVLKATTTYEVPANSTGSERKDLRVIHANVLSTSGLGLMVDNAEPSY